MVKQPEWAEGVVEVANLRSRVYTQWVNGNENFFYRGSARDLNEAIRKFAAVRDDERQLVLLPGPGQALTFQRKAVDCDWKLHIPSGIYKAVSKRSHAVMTVYINVRKPRPPRDRQRVEQWLADLNQDSFAARKKAERELRKLGNDAKPFLRQALKAGPAPEARRRIEGLLEKLRGFDVTDLEIPKGVTVVTADDLVAVHLQGLKDPDRTVRGMAVQDLSRVAPYSDKVVPAITAMLAKDQDQWVRLVAAACLGQMGARARPALPALKKGLDDPDANIRKAFQTAIEQIVNAKDQPGRDDDLPRKLAILKEIRAFKKAIGGRN